MKQESADKNRKLSELEDNKAHLPASYDGCTEVTRSSYNDPTGNNLPIYVGKHPTKGILLSLGTNNPYCTDVYTFNYIINALTEMRDKMNIIPAKPDTDPIYYEDGFKAPAAKKDSRTEELEKLVRSTIKSKFDAAGVPVPDEAIKTGGSLPVEMTDEEAKELGKTAAEEYLKDPKNKQSISAFKALKDVLGDIKGAIANNEPEEPAAVEEPLAVEEDHTKEDLTKIMDKMTPEEKEAVAKKQVEEARDEMYAKLKKLEQELLGEIESEEDIKYDYDYYKKVFDKGKLPALREELAKIPKENRQAIINQIVEEHSKRQTT